MAHRFGNLARRIHHEGLWMPILALVVYFLDWFSLNSWLRAGGRAIAPVRLPDDKVKTPPLVSEIYVTLALLVAFWAVDSTGPAVGLNNWLRVLCYWWPLYRLTELGHFVVGWIFVHRDYLHSNERSLAGFLLNTVEVSALLTSLSIVTGRANDVERWSQLWSTVSELLTLSPPDFTAIGFARFGLGVFLVLCALSSVAGGIARETVRDAKKQHESPTQV